MNNVSAIIDFEPSLYVSADALSKTYEIVIGNEKGLLYLPSLPDWSKDISNHRLEKLLIGPNPAATWMQGDKLIYWGKPRSYPSGESVVTKAYVEFDLNNRNNAQNIYNHYSTWRDLLYKYIKILTTQGTDNNTTVLSESRGMIWLYENTDTLTDIENQRGEEIFIDVPKRDCSLHYEQLKLATTMASEKKDLKIEYRLLLNALEARSKKDYRMALIDAANAIEMCLKSKIIEECIRQKINFCDDLLAKYKMLGGKIELAKMLGVLPKKDYSRILNKPRNDVMHDAVFPSKASADQMIETITEMLRELQPIIYE